MGAHLQTAQLQGVMPVISPNTTHNWKYGIYQNEALNQGETPVLGYWGIGNKGHVNSTGIDGIGLRKEVQYTSKFMDLIGRMPFVLRPLDNDLSTIEKTRFRLRTIYTDKATGKRYYAYWAKIFEPMDSPIKNMYVTRDGDNENSIEFSPDEKDLYPTAPPMTNAGVYVSTGDYIRCASTRTLSMTSDDIKEYMNVCNIIYGSPDYAFISEIVLSTGVDRILPGDLNGAEIRYKEAICVQAYGFVAGYEELSNKTSMSMTLDIGASETLIALTKV